MLLSLPRYICHWGAREHLWSMINGKWYRVSIVYNLWSMVYGLRSMVEALYLIVYGLWLLFFYIYRLRKSMERLSVLDSYQLKPFPVSMPCENYHQVLHRWAAQPYRCSLTHLSHLAYYIILPLLLFAELRLSSSFNFSFIILSVQMGSDVTVHNSSLNRWHLNITCSTSTSTPVVCKILCCCLPLRVFYLTQASTLGISLCV